MPPPPGGKKKKKGRAPKHQNTFAFRHNAKSKKTEKILSSPNVGVCRRCWDKIEWRKKYRKYKPRTQPGKCNICCNRNVMAAYHTICTKCAMSDVALVAMKKHQNEASCDESPENPKVDSNDVDAEMKEQEDSVPTQLAQCESINENNRTIKTRSIKVCAVCTHEPALSKYDNMPPEASELVSQIQELEDTLEDGIGEDGHKLTLREIKTIERQLEKLKLDIKEFGKKKSESDEAPPDESGEDNECNDGDELSVDSDESDHCYEEEDEDDPFLKAVGGKDKLLVGDEYQKMLLARAEAGDCEN